MAIKNDYGNQRFYSECPICCELNHNITGILKDKAYSKKKYSIYRLNWYSQEVSPGSKRHLPNHLSFFRVENKVLPLWREEFS